MTITGTAVATRNGQDLAQPGSAPPSSALAIRPGQMMFDDKQRAALAVLGIKDATNADLAVFMHYCQRTQLDPFSRQVYLISRREKQGDQWVAKQAIQVGIDGFRVIRDRIAQRLGIAVEYEDTIWYDSEGTAYNVWLWEHPPTACAVTVVKDGHRFPGVVRTAAYAATNKQGDMVAQWRTQPEHMIEKCAEAFALRRAFPNDLGGIYLPEETGAGDAAPPPPAVGARAEVVRERQPRQHRPAGQATPAPTQEPDSDDPGPADPGEPAAARPAARAASGQVGIIHSHFKRLGYEDHDREERLVCTALLADPLGSANLASSSDLTQDQARRVIKVLDGCKDRPALMDAVHEAQQQAADAAGGEEGE